MPRTGWKLPILAVALLGSCAGSPLPLDLTAQRAEQTAITVEWLRYIDADAVLTAAQKASRHDTAAAQDLRIRKAEEAVGILGGNAR